MWVLIDPPAVEITRRDRVRTHKGGTAYLFVAPSHDIPKKKRNSGNPRRHHCCSVFFPATP